MQKEGFGFVWKGSWLAFVERIVLMTVKLRSRIWEARIIQRVLVLLFASLVKFAFVNLFLHFYSFY